MLVFGSTVANAGIIIGSRAETEPTEDTKTILTEYLTITARFLTTGIIIGSSAELQQKGGIIIGS